eukprot:scaffold456_cov390-Prasinococcus_capsulatus_cf.AAC.1
MDAARAFVSTAHGTPCPTRARALHTLCAQGDRHNGRASDEFTGKLCVKVHEPRTGRSRAHLNAPCGTCPSRRRPPRSAPLPRSLARVPSYVSGLQSLMLSLLRKPNPVTESRPRPLQMYAQPLSSHVHALSCRTELPEGRARGNVHACGGLLEAPCPPTRRVSEW